MAHRPAHDPAQDVAGTLVGRRDPLGEKERHGPRVIGDDLVAEALRLHRLGVMPDERGQALDDRHEEVGPVVRVHFLDRARHALEAHAGVDALERQRSQRAVGGAVELHEHQVPDLEPARAVLRVVRHAVGTLGEMRAAVVVELAAGPAGPGVAHPPEVLLVADGDVAPAHEPLGREPDLLGPDAVRLVVVGVDGRGDALGVQAELIGQELPVPSGWRRA